MDGRGEKESPESSSHPSVGVSPSHHSSKLDGTQGTQVNQIVTHANLPLLCTAHEDHVIRFLDVGSGKCVHSQGGHVDSVSSLDFSPLGDALASGGRREGG